MDRAVEADGAARFDRFVVVLDRHGPAAEADYPVGGTCQVSGPELFVIMLLSPAFWHTRCECSRS